jgi:hypothetical protein
MPGIDTSMPSRAAINPLSWDPSLSEVMSASAMITRAKFSNGPKATPIFASGGVSSTRTSQDSPPPMREAALPRPSARPGYPARASG